MVERGELASDDLVLGDPMAPLGRPQIRQLPCTRLLAASLDRA